MVFSPLGAAAGRRRGAGAAAVRQVEGPQAAGAAPAPAPTTRSAQVVAFAIPHERPPRASSSACLAPDPSRHAAPVLSGVHLVLVAGRVRQRVCPTCCCGCRGRGAAACAASAASRAATSTRAAPARRTAPKRGRAILRGVQPSERGRGHAQQVSVARGVIRTCSTYGICCFGAMGRSWGRLCARDGSQWGRWRGTAAWRGSGRPAPHPRGRVHGCVRPGIKSSIKIIIINMSTHG